MNPIVKLGEEGFTLTWSPVHEGSEYLVFLERCDRQYLATGGVDCERILSENVTLATPDPTTNVSAVEDAIELVSPKVLDLCQFYYNVRIDAMGADARLVFRETAVLAKCAFQHSEKMLCVSMLLCLFASPSSPFILEHRVVSFKIRSQEPPRMRGESGGDPDWRARLCQRPHSDVYPRHRPLSPASPLDPARAHGHRQRPPAAHRPRPLEGLDPTLPEGEVRAPVGQEGVRGRGGGVAAIG